MVKGGRISRARVLEPLSFVTVRGPNVSLTNPPPKTLFPMALWETSHYFSNRLLMSLYRRAMVETVSPALFEERRQIKRSPNFLQSRLFSALPRWHRSRGARAGGGEKKHLQRIRAASWKSWEQLKSSFDCKEGVLSHPPHPPFPPCPPCARGPGIEAPPSH